jgi:hypothetical protein
MRAEMMQSTDGGGHVVCASADALCVGVVRANI